MPLPVYHTGFSTLHEHDLRMFLLLLVFFFSLSWDSDSEFVKLPAHPGINEIRYRLLPLGHFMFLALVIIYSLEHETTCIIQVVTLTCPTVTLPFLGFETKQHKNKIMTSGGLSEKVDGAIIWVINKIPQNLVTWFLTFLDHGPHSRVGIIPVDLIESYVPKLPISGPFSFIYLGLFSDAEPLHWKDFFVEIRKTRLKLLINFLRKMLHQIVKKLCWQNIGAFYHCTINSRHYMNMTMEFCWSFHFSTFLNMWPATGIPPPHHHHQQCLAPTPLGWLKELYIFLSEFMFGSW